jgi:hypothetical protein
MFLGEGPDRTRSLPITWLRKKIYWALITVSILMFAVEASRQYKESRYVKVAAWEIVNRAGANNARQRAIALRDYLRQSVTFQSAPMNDRPFLRASAAETLQSGKGYCGEVTRAFIQMADAVGIRAQRINLYGKNPHVVAEAELSPGDAVIVDCQHPPQIRDLEKLDQVILRPEYDDYYTLNLRRLRINWLVSRIKTEIGPLTYWTENPHALKSALWFGLAFFLTVYKVARWSLRYLLHKRGWVHVSNLKRVGVSTSISSID